MQSVLLHSLPLIEFLLILFIFNFQQYFYPCNSLGKIHFFLIIVFCLWGNLLCKCSSTCCHLVNYTKYQDESFQLPALKDYQKYFHVNEQGHVWLDGRNNPIPLTQKLTKRINSIPSQTHWSGRHTRSGVHSKDTPPHKGGPHNSTGNTKVPPSLGTPTSHIPTDQEIHRDIIQGVLDDPKISKSWLGTDWEETKNLFSPNKIDNLQYGHKISQPISNSSDSHHLVHLSPQMVLILLTWVQHNLQIIPIPTTRVQHQI